MGAPPTLHDLQMDKGCPPPTLHDLQMDKSWGPCNPSRLGNGLQMGRLPNGQGLGASPTPICKWTRVGLHDSPPPRPFRTCKWTRVGGPNPSRLTNGQGLGPPTLHDLQMDNGWTRVGAPRISPPYQHCRWTRVGPPQPFAIWGGSPNKLYRFNIRFQADQAPCPKIDKTMTGPFGPERTPTQTLNFCLDKHWGLQTIERLSIFLRGPGASPQIETSMTSPSSQNVR